MLIFLDDGCALIIVNGKVLAQGSQYVLLKELERCRHVSKALVPNLRMRAYANILKILVERCRGNYGDN